MNEQEARSLVTSTGRQLLREGLVVRTWGNVSCRLDDTRFLITPSGLGYNQTKDEDLAIYDWQTKEWEGPHKPSSEKGIHAAAYELFTDAGFVIHTHQAYASALSVYGADDLDITPKEIHRLGGVGAAGYGLPGTKMLLKEVMKVMDEGNRTILMKNHGAVIIGKDRDDAYERALLLEEICKRSFKGGKYIHPVKPNAKINRMITNLQKTYPNAAWVDHEAVVAWSKSGKPLVAQLDDMAQMIGRKIDVVAEKNAFTLEEKLYEALEKKNAILVRGFGAIVNGKDEDDTIALKALVEKACITKLHTYASKVNPTISPVDSSLMYMVYQNKYSKLKKEEE